MKKVCYIPERGDIVWITMDPTLGREQKGHRPALVLSSREYNEKTELAIVCPITSKVKGYPFEIVIMSKKIKGAVLVDQLRTLDWAARKMKFIEKASVKVIGQVQDIIEVLLVI